MAETRKLDDQVRLLEEIGEYSLDPLGFVKYAYDWGRGQLETSGGPYKWQSEILSLIGGHLQNPKTVNIPLRIAVASGHGIGKSGCLSMIVDWAMSTCEDARVIITAGTGMQLKTKTQPEISKWFRLSINEHWFEVKAQSITVKNEKHKDSWRADLVTWDANNSEAFAGLHNKRKRIVVIFDEAAAISDVIWDVTQGALTDEETEIIWLAFGNPTQNQGRFAECFGSDRARWRTHQIDSRTVEGTNKVELQEWVDKYGEDSDYVRVRVRGEFPRAGSAQFIPHDLVAAARNYKSVGHENLPKILTCDVARFGDNETVIALRQGRKFEIKASYRGLDTVQTTERVIEFKIKENPDATIIDGDGIGGAVVDGMKHRGYGDKLFEFHGGGEPNDGNMFFNKRSECWGYTRDWLAAGAEIPNDPQLERQLTGPTYDIVRGKVHHGSILLESKQDMAKRGLESPDKGDALAMSFGVKVLPKPKSGPPPRPASMWS
jgi:hypothetical protein